MSHGSAHRLGRHTGPPQPLRRVHGQRAMGDGAPIRDLPQQSPYRLLKRGALPMDRRLKLRLAA